MRNIYFSLNHVSNYKTVLLVEVISFVNKIYNSKGMEIVFKPVNMFLDYNCYYYYSCIDDILLCIHNCVSCYYDYISFV